MAHHNPCLDAEADKYRCTYIHMQLTRLTGFLTCTRCGRVICRLVVLFRLFRRVVEIPAVFPQRKGEVKSEMPTSLLRYPELYVECWFRPSRYGADCNFSSI